MLKILSILVTLTLFAAPVSAEWKANKGEGYVLCEALRERLNRYPWDPNDFIHFCAWELVASYPGFKEPPWEELDAVKHEDLIFELLKYRACGVEGYFGRRPCNINMPDDVHRRETQKFVNEGGKIQVWRTRLIREFANGPAPSDPQTVVQLRWKTSGQFEKQRCPNLPHVGWRIGGLYITKNDLSGPDPRVKPWASYLNGRTVFFYDGKLHYIAFSDEILIGIDRDGMPSDFCTLKYERTQRREP